MPNRSKFKKLTNQWHEQEKEHIITLHALIITTSSYAGDTAIPECDDEDDHDDIVEDQQ